MAAALRLYDVKWSASGNRKLLATSDAEAQRTVEEMLLVGSNDSELVELGDCYPTVDSVVLITPPAKLVPEFPAEWDCPACGQRHRENIHPVEGPFLSVICPETQATFSDQKLSPDSVESLESARTDAEAYATAKGLVGHSPA